VRIRKQQPLPSLIAHEIPFEAPEPWEWLRLGEIGFTQTGTTPSSDDPECFGDHIPFVKSADLTGNTTNYSGPGLSKQGIEHSRLIRGHSVLMVCIGSSIGKVNVTDRDICCNQQINAVSPYLELLTTFISFALKADYFQKLVLANAGMGTLPIISKGKWELLPVPIPPIPEQQRIVAKVDELMALCDRLEMQLTTAQTEGSRLLEAVLHQSLAEAS
jgi:type I restriction enzyme S subunit